MAKAEFDQQMEADYPMRNPFAGADNHDDDLSGMELPSDQKVSTTALGIPDEDPAPVVEEQPGDETPVEEPVEETGETTEEPSEAETGDTTEAVAEETPAEETQEHEATIPQSRLNKEIRRRKEALEQVESLKKQLEAQKAEMTSLDVESDATAMFDALLDGDMKTATQVFGKIVNSVRETTRQETLQQVDAHVAIGAAQQGLKMSVTDVIHELKESYPVLDDSSEQYDPETVEQTLYFQEYYMGKGDDPASALEKSAQQVLKLRHPELLQTKPTVDLRAKTQAERRTAAIQKGIEGQQKQPPRLKAQTQTQPAVRIDQMSDAEFDKLAKEELARMRGDII